MPIPGFLRFLGRDAGPSTRAKRQCRLNVTRLESRTVMDASVLSIAANPATLWPPNGRLVPVRVSGVIAQTDDTNVGARYRVVDEYGAVQPRGPVALSNNGDGTFSYAFTVRLQARRLGQDRDGRQYTILVNSFDADSSDTASTVVTVPHDRGRRGGFNPGRGAGDDGPFRGDDGDDNRGERRSRTSKRGNGRGARDLAPIGRDSDDGPGKSKDKGKGRGRD